MVLERMKNVLKDKFEIDSSDMTRETIFRNEGLGFDSMSFMEYLVFLEEEFDVSIPDEALDKMNTLGDLEDHITAEMQK